MLRTVDRLEEVIPEARSQVMVIDPVRPLSGDQVYVADLRRSGPVGPPVWVESRGAWLDRNIPRHSVVEPLARAPAPKRRPHRRRHRPRQAAATAAAPAVDAGAASPAPAAQGPAPRVVMFSTSWCPSCKSARQFFASRNIEYADLDVEKDQTAARQYMAIQQRFNLRRGVVPLIVVNGRLFQGFSAPQIEAALREPQAL